MSTINLLIIIFMAGIASVQAQAMPGLTADAQARVIQEEWKNALERNTRASAVLTDVVPEREKATSTTESVLQLTLTGRMSRDEALKRIASVLNCSLLIGPGVENKEISMDFQDVDPIQALNALLYPEGYGFRLNGKELLVLATETRVFRLSLPPVNQTLNNMTTNETFTGGVDGSRAGAASVSASAGRVRVGTKVVVENAAENLSYWDDVERNVRALLSPTGVVSLNRVGGILLVTDKPQALLRVNAFIRELAERLSRRILVDVKVLEVELSNEHHLGIDWAVLMQAGGLKNFRSTTNFSSQNMVSGSYMTLSGQMNKPGSGDTETGVSALVRALDAFGRVEVVSQPRVVMLNNTVANIQVGETKSYVETASIETTQSGGTVTAATLNEVHGGVTLQIMGNISGDDIFLNVTPVVSSVDEIRTIVLGGGAKLEAPETSMKSINAFVRLKEGETAVLGGLITRNALKQRSGVPVLDRLPLLGRLFSYDVVKNRRTELVILITPRKG